MPLLLTPDMHSAIVGWAAYCAAGYAMQAIASQREHGAQSAAPRGRAGAP
jgi:hypothetical protein